MTRGKILKVETLKASGLCGKFVNRLFTATVVRARQKNAGIAGPTSSHALQIMVNAALATVAKKSVYELSKQPTRLLVFAMSSNSE